MTPEQRSLRASARAEILDVANKRSVHRYRDRFGPRARPTFTSRRLQQAVCMVRRQQLVEAAVLEAAGFRP